MKPSPLTIALPFFLACSQSERFSTQQYTIDERPATGILGGQSAEKTNPLFSHIVSVFDYSKNRFCTGVLISPTLVLTAAHCISPQLQKFKVFHSLRTESFFGGSNIQKAAIHRDYIDLGDGNVAGVDIALLSLDAPLKNTQPALLLADSALLVEGTKTLVYGYGITLSRGQEKNSFLRFTKKSVRLSPDARFFYYDQSDGTGICFGDSGGPHFVNINHLWQVAGITSSIRSSESQLHKCYGQSNMIKVSHFISWINEATQKLAKAAPGKFLKY